MIRTLFWCLLALAAAGGCSGGEDEQFISLPLARFIFYGQRGEELPQGNEPGFIAMDRLLEKVLLSNGTMVELTAGTGSGLYHSNADPEGLFYAVTGRGPTLPCSRATDMGGGTVCEEGTVFVLPEYSPAIHTLRLDFEAGSYETLAELPLRASLGIPANGLPNDSAQSERAFSAYGDPLPLDVSGLDPEALVRLADGTFWVADEYGPSLVHVGQNGVIQERLVPRGRERAYSGAPYPVSGVLPEEYARRSGGGGFTALALDKDETELFAVMASPLNATGAVRRERPVRILVLDPRTRRPKAEYVYLLDEREGSEGRVTEAVAVNRDSLLVMEWMGRARIYLARLREATNVLDGLGPDRLAVETAGLDSLGVKAAAKSLVLEIGGTPAGASPLEAMSFLPPATLVLASDSGYGLQGHPTMFRRVNILEQQPLP